MDDDYKRSRDHEARDSMRAELGFSSCYQYQHTASYILLRSDACSWRLFISIHYGIRNNDIDPLAQIRSRTDFQHPSLLRVALYPRWISYFLQGAIHTSKCLEPGSILLHRYVQKDHLEEKLIDDLASITLVQVVYQYYHGLEPGLSPTKGRMFSIAHGETGIQLLGKVKGWKHPVEFGSTLHPGSKLSRAEGFMVVKKRVDVTTSF